MQEDSELEEYSKKLEGAIDKTEGEAKKLKEEMNLRGIRRDRLISIVFGQTNEGKELLEMWKEDKLIKDRSLEGQLNPPLYFIGHTLGEQNFIRKIIITIEKVNKGERGV